MHVKGVENKGPSFRDAYRLQYTFLSSLSWSKKKLATLSSFFFDQDGDLENVYTSWYLGSGFGVLGYVPVVLPCSWSCKVNKGPSFSDVVGQGFWPHTDCSIHFSSALFCNKKRA